MKNKKLIKSMIAPIVALFLLFIFISLDTDRVEAASASTLPEYTDASKYYEAFGEHVFYAEGYFYFATKDKKASSYNSVRYRTLGFEVSFNMEVVISSSVTVNKTFFCAFTYDKDDDIEEDDICEHIDTTVVGDYEYNLYCVSKNALGNKFDERYSDKNAAGYTVGKYLKMAREHEIYIDSLMTIVQPDGTKEGLPEGTLTIATNGTPYFNPNKVYDSEAEMEAAWSKYGSRDFSSHYKKYSKAPSTPSVVLIDIDGRLDGTVSDSTAGFLTFDLYLDGKQVANDATEYKWHPVMGTKYELKDIKAATGYTYTGITNGAPISGKIGTQDVLVILNASTNKYTIKYNGNGATSGSTANSSHTYGVAKNLTANGFARTGYKFAGWATSSTGAVAYSNGQSVKNLTSTNNGVVNLYAVWVSDTYTVTYNGNGATGGSTANSTHTINVAKNLTANGFTRLGYRFAGWSTSSTGAVAYSNSQSVKNLSTSGSATINLYAKWTANTYTVAYNGNGATGGSTANSSHTYDVAKNLTSCGYTKTGYTFAGWSTSASGVAVYSNGQSVKNLTSTHGGTVTLYAKWIPNTYTIVYNGNGATGGSTANSTHTYNTRKALTSNGFTKTGYTFVGWNTNAAGTGTSYANGDSVLNLTTVNNGTIILYAQWVDKTAPTASITIYPSSWAYQSTVTILANDSGSGIVKVELYRVGANTDALVQSQSFSRVKQGGVRYTHAFEGIYQYYGIVYDASGNIYKTPIGTVYVDRTKPVIDIINTPEEWETKGKFIIDADITDALSGIKTQDITVNGVAVSNEHILTEDGIYDVQFSAKDNAGNTNEATIQVKMDKTEPNIAADIPEGWITEQSYTFHVDVTDNLSGVKEYKVYCDGKELYNDYIITEDGNYVFTVIAYDYAGNMAVKSFRVKLDHTAPLIEDNNSKLKTGVIDYIATDLHSGVASFKLYDLEGKEYASYDTVTGILHFASYPTYITEFYLEAYDNAGNVSRLKVETPYNFRVEAELSGARTYKDDFIGYKVGTDVTLDIETFGYVDKVEIIFSWELNQYAIKEGYELDRSEANGMHYILEPVLEEDKIQYVFKLPEMVEFAESVKRLKKDYTVMVIAYRNGYKKGVELDLPVVNAAYIKSQIAKHFYTIIIE